MFNGFFDEKLGLLNLNHVCRTGWDRASEIRSIRIYKEGEKINNIEKTKNGKRNERTNVQDVG